MEHNRYGFSITLANTNLDDAIEKITAALGEVGFGVLTRIDVSGLYGAVYRVSGAFGVR